MECMLHIHFLIDAHLFIYFVCYFFMSGYIDGHWTALVILVFNIKVSCSGTALNSGKQDNTSHSISFFLSFTTDTNVSSLWAMERERDIERLESGGRIKRKIKPCAIICQSLSRIKNAFSSLIMALSLDHAVLLWSSVRWSVQADVLMIWTSAFPKDRAMLNKALYSYQ